MPCTSWMRRTWILRPVSFVGGGTKGRDGRTDTSTTHVWTWCAKLSAIPPQESRIRKARRKPSPRIKRPHRRCWRRASPRHAHVPRRTRIIGLEHPFVLCFAACPVLHFCVLHFLRDTCVRHNTSRAVLHATRDHGAHRGRRHRAGRRSARAAATCRRLARAAATCDDVSVRLERADRAHVSAWSRRSDVVRLAGRADLRLPRAHAARACDGTRDVRVELARPRAELGRALRAPAPSARFHSGHVHVARVRASCARLLDTSATRTCDDESRTCTVRWCERTTHVRNVRSKHTRVQRTCSSLGRMNGGGKRAAWTAARPTQNQVGT